MDLTQTLPAEFEIEGFLSPKMSKIPNVIRKEYPEWFDFARSVNKLCQEALYKIDVKKKITLEWLGLYFIFITFNYFSRQSYVLKVV